MNKDLNVNSIFCLFYDLLEKNFVSEVFTSSTYRKSFRCITDFEKDHPSLRIIYIFHLGSVIKELNDVHKSK